MYGQKERDAWVRSKRRVASVLALALMGTIYMTFTSASESKDLWVVLDVAVIVLLMGCAVMEDSDDPNNFDTYF